MKNLMRKILSLLLFSTMAVIASCSDDDDNKAVVCNQVKSYITQHYPGAIIRDAEYSRGYLEVEIYHAAHIKDVYFDSTDNWVATKWDVSIVDLPAAVVTSLTENFPEYRIDDVDYVVTPEREAYYVELERGNYERTVYVATDGTILKE